MQQIAFLIIGLLIGYGYRSFRDFMRETEKRFKEKPKPEVGVTPGLYKHANENNVNQSGDTGFTTPKTPWRLEWEEQERLREEQLHVRVK
jgi:hypothetical protein